MENKTTAERAQQLFGKDWSQIICRATTALQPQFSNRYLIYKNKCGRIDAGAITLGWKFELLNVSSGQLSGDMRLTREQVIDVYAGTNLPSDKRNAVVNGRAIPSSGIANFILFESQPFSSPQDVIDALIDVEDYVSRHPNVYFGCKALNYRTFRKKYDGNRPLAVYVDWSAARGKLCSKLCFDKPLMQGGDDACAQLLQAMEQLGVHTTDDLNQNNVDNPHTIWDI